MTEMNASSGGHHAPGTGGAILQTVSVADLLDRRVALEWFESVAIVAELCSTLAERQVIGVPALHHVVLTPEGTIALAGRGEDVDPAALPRVLHQLLAVVPPPTALRLFVLHAISSDGDKSATAFGKAVAYYERPGRDEVIRAVRQKYFETPLPLPGTAAPKPFEVPVVETTAKTEPASAAPRRPRRWLVAIALALSLGTAVAVVAASRNGHAGSANVLRTVDVLLAKTGEAGRDVARAVAERLTSRVAAQPETPPAADVTPSPSLPAKRRSTPKQPTSTDSTIAPLVEEPASTETAEDATVPVPEATPVPETSPEPLVAPVPETSRATTLEPTAPQESVDNTGIVPPRLLEPIRLPAWVDPVNRTPLSSFELEIGVDGTVTSIRMLSPAMRLTDMMILSAAKTWVFVPASLDGRPVPYRLTLGLAANR